MTTIDNEPNGPHLEWCADCDRPTELCECDRTANTARTTNTPPQARETEPNTEHTQARAGTEHRTRTEPNAAERANTGRTRPTEQARSGAPGALARLWAWIAEWGPLIPIWVLAGALGVAGFAVSFYTVEAKMRPYFADLAWLVPVAVDLGIITFTLLDIFLARRAQRIPWMRYIPWALTAATIYLNVTAYTVLEAQVAHAVLPSLWVVFSEAIARIMRQKAEDEQPTSKQIPPIRWICAPAATLILWRAMKLWKIPTYDRALEIEEERQLAKAVMKERFGKIRRAPLDLKVRYRQRKITVAEVEQRAAETGPVRQRPARSANTTGPNQAPDRAEANGKERTRSVRSAPARSRSARTEPAPNKPKPRGGRSATERLAAALAALRNEGVPNPSVRELAERAGVKSTSTAHAFLKNINNKGTA
ncbi:DUF2637 domain-containing protein [Glycomyces salinus]|uniref:DUF2637 domain-containing protein n=1 Tax=Glycomyces salinus TaxID=980294 RepID=UPI0018EC2161|nr:DUF2637 domain-containing protein [Glycomyces salinus]